MKEHLLAIVFLGLLFLLYLAPLPDSFLNLDQKKDYEQLEEQTNRARTAHMPISNNRDTAQVSVVAASTLLQTHEIITHPQKTE